MHQDPQQCPCLDPHRVEDRILLGLGLCIGHLGLGKLAFSFLTPELESTPINSKCVLLALVISRDGGWSSSC